jgi:hypothetical protein
MSFRRDLRAITREAEAAQPVAALCGAALGYCQILGGLLLLSVP